MPDASIGPDISSSRTIRVGFFCDVDSYGGIHTYTRNLAPQLRRHNMQVEVVTCTPETEAECAVADRLRDASRNLLLVPRDRNRHRQLAAFARLLREQEFDVFIPNYRQLMYAVCAQWSRYGDTKCIGVCRNDHESNYTLFRRYQDIIHALVCPAPATYTRLSQLLPKRSADIHHIPHGVAVNPDYSPCYQGGEIRLLYHGRLEESQKAISEQILLAEELRRRNVPFQLTLLGNGPDRDIYRRMVAEKQLQRFVEIAEARDELDVQKIIGASHLAVLTSRYEGFCFSLAEAMGAGLPAVVFECSVLDQYVTDGSNGWMVPWGDVPAMAERIQRFTENVQQWDKFSRSARDAIRARFGVELFASRYAALIRKLMLQNERRRWPKTRPLLVPERGKSLQSLVERAGRFVRAWN